jgi:predicted CopG family antitoxin
MLPTTIQVSDETKKFLDSLKKEKHLRSYDEVIKGLVRPVSGIPESILRACRGSRRFEREVEKEHAF